MEDTMLFTSICKKLERSARNGERMNLTAEESRALVAHFTYSMITAERTKELVATWGGTVMDPPVPPAPVPTLVLPVEDQRQARGYAVSIKGMREAVERTERVREATRQRRRQ